MRYSVMPVLIVILSLAYLPLVSSQQAASFVPAERESITAENLSQLERIGTIGGGWWLRDVEWSPDGSTIAVASLGGILLYDANDLYAAPTVLDTQTQEVTGIAFSPDGTQLASHNLDSTILIWDVVNHTIANIVQRKGYWIDDVTYKANIDTIQNDKIIFDLQEVFLYNNNALFRRIPEFGITQTILYFQDSPVGVAISEDRRLVASTHGLYGDDEYSLSIWEFATGEPLVTIPLKTDTSGVALSPDGRWMVTFPQWYGDIYLWNVDKLLKGNLESAVVELTGPTLPVKGAAFSPDGTQLALVGWDENHSQLESSLWVWDLRSAQPTATILRSASTGAPRLKADGTLVHYQGRVWDVHAGRDLHVTDDTIWNITDDFTRATTSDQLQFSREQRSFYLTHCLDEGEDCTVTRRIWDIMTGNLLETDENNDYRRETTAKNLKASPTADGIQLVDPASAVILHTLPLDDPVRWFSFSQNGEKFVTVSGADNADTDLLILWDVATGADLNKVELDRSQLRYTFSPDESLLFVWSGGIAYVWDTTTGAEQYSLIGPEPNILWYLSFAPDGNTFAVGWGDWTNITELRSIHSGEVLDTLEGFPNFISDTAFSPDGRLLAILSMNEIWLWNTSTKELRVLSKDEPFSWYDAIQFSPDSRFIGAEFSSQAYWADAFTDLWNIDTEKLIMTLDGDGLQATGNWDLLLTEEKGFVHFWGIPSNNG